MTAALLLGLLLLAAEPTARWPGFLGAGATEVVPQSLPVQWSPTENLAWTRPLPGYGQSSPVIWGERAYVTSVDGPRKETLHVLCVRLADGAILWDHAVSSSYPQTSSVYISRAAPTPVVDEHGIYAYFESGDVIALTLDGKPRWSRSLTKDYGPPQNEFGLAASPVQTADRIMVLVDDVGPSYLLALDKATGDVVWKTDRASRKSWASPALIPFGETVQIVVSSAGSVTGYDPQTGRPLWEFGEVGGNTGTTPVAAGDGVFLISASPGREGDFAEEAKKSNGLMSVQKIGDEWVPRFVWTNPAASPSWGSPIVHQGLAYWVNRVGVVYCLDVTTGQIAYTERVKQGCWATPVGIGDQIYIFGKDGLTTVLASGEEFRVLAENVLWSADQPPTNHVPSPAEESEERRRSAAMFSRPTVYGVAIVNGAIVLRTGSQLFCVRQAGTTFELKEEVR
jgi:outer membrane protein assembly factor BamB